jgi:thiol:disulfide interchange protein DsbC
MASIKKDDFITFSPKGETKASVVVFTDVDCGYCRKLHKEIPRLNEMGVEVKYLAYPRAGIGSNSYNKIASAWCAEDRQDAMNKLKAGEEIPMNVCESNPVAEQFNIGIQAGLNGTPAIVLDSGELIPGYMPADKLAQTIGI